MPSSFFTKQQLSNWYLKEGLSTYQISEICDCDAKTVYYWLKSFQIPTRPRKVIHTSKELIESLYNQGLSMASIGKKLGCCSAAVLRKIRKYNIKSRSCWESNIIHKRLNFSGSLIEKAHLIGFRIGDLHITKSLNFIHVSSNTTKIDQLIMMKKLFAKYGPIWIGKTIYKNRKVFTFATSLNKSFDFLTIKFKNIPKWIVEDEECFFAFFAGYTDAEGSIGIYNKMTRFRVGSYDKKILSKIHNKLLALQIQNSFNLETPAGKNKQNGDFWRISLSEKMATFKCLSRLFPYLRHFNRVKMAKLALKNLLSRL